jgi:hypothetical protein
MGKAPAFQFYVKDWLGDAELQMATSSSRGIWINALCFMWEAKERGKLVGTIEELSKLLFSSNGDFIQFLEDVKRHKFADVSIVEKNVEICGNLMPVTVRNNLVTLINRRMYREQKEREITRLRVQRFRCNKKSNDDVTPPSSSSSSNIINNKKFYYRDDQHNLVCKTCKRIFSEWKNFKGHKCEENDHS